MILHKNARNKIFSFIVLSLCILFISSDVGAEDEFEFELCAKGDLFEGFRARFKSLNLAAHYWKDHPVWGSYIVPWEADIQTFFDNGAILMTTGNLLYIQFSGDPFGDTYSIGILGFDPDGGQLIIRDVPVIQTGPGGFGMILYDIPQEDADGYWALEEFEFVDPVTQQVVFLSGANKFQLLECPLFGPGWFE